jgi:predicted enzyme related to lactoylglutathione lyase
MEKKMSDADKQTPINYVEFPANDLSKIKAFYTAAFNWVFTDYGPEYVAFSNAGIDGGFDAAADREPSRDGALVVLLEQDLEAALARVEKAGGQITKAIFSFPGGRRFQFLDPSGNELSVWSTH